MAALRHAVEPQQPEEFGKGIDSGKHWPESIAENDRSIEVVKAWRIQNDTIWKQVSEFPSFQTFSSMSLV
jgi:hypothetical protein